MRPDQIVRAWKDADYGAALTPDAAALVPAHPVGPIELPDDALELDATGAASRTEFFESLGCCQGFTQLGACDFTAGYPYCTATCFTFIFTHGCTPSPT